MQGILLTGLAGAITFGGGWLALRTRSHRGAIYAFCAGALIATALLGLVPESIELAIENGSGIESTLLATLAGFFLFYVLENLPHRGSPNPEVLHHSHGHSTGLWAAAGLAFHGFMDGLAIGEALTIEPHLGWSIAFGVVMHKLADGVNVTGVMRGTQQGERATLGMLGLTAIAPLVGAIVHPFLDLSLAVHTLLLGWFAGVFLYLGATSLLPAAHEAGGSRWIFAFALAGAAFVYSAQALAGHG